MIQRQKLRSAMTAFLTALCLALCLRCGGGGGHHGAPAPMLFSCSGAAAITPDQISITCPAFSASPLLMTVVIGGPTTSSDIYGVKFDLVFSQPIMTFDTPAIEGTLLNQSGAATTLDAAASPGDPDRVVVSITRTGAVSGTQAAAASTTIVILGFAATGLDGTATVTFENAQAVDSTLTPIGSIGGMCMATMCTLWRESSSQPSSQS